jgi:hypothetical protein
LKDVLLRSPYVFVCLGLRPMPAGTDRSFPAFAHLSSQPPVDARTIALTVPDGTPQQMALDREVRVRMVGEPVTQPVFVFDSLVIPRIRSDQDLRLRAAISVRLHHRLSLRDGIAGS